jgi:hypothetical protein
MARTHRSQVDCEHIRPLLSVYLDGELAPARQAEVAAHLDACPDCARALADFRALGQEIRALPEVPPPPGLRPAFAPRPRRGGAFRSFGARLLVSGATAVVLVTMLIGLAVGVSEVLRRMEVAGQTTEVVATYPPDGATDVPVNANLTLTFGRPMDRASVESALIIVPQVQLAFAWQGETLTVVPFADWQPGTAYTLTIAGSARGLDGALLDRPFVLRFETAGRPPTESLNPIGRFAIVWRAELGGPAGPLGYATAHEQELWCARQRFERGLMIWLDQLREDHIYVLVYGADGADETGGVWQRYVDVWREGDPESGGLTPPVGLVEPIRGFGRLWREELGGPDAGVGWALEPEQGFVGSVQLFEHGVMVWDPVSAAVYVLWDDGSWTVYPAPG